MHQRSAHNPSGHLRAEGNLDYLGFIRLVERIWCEAHPEIPFLPTGGGQPAQYPCINYSLELRKAHPNEPKVRYREVREDNGDIYVIAGQRFQNVISFTAVAERNPVLAEEVIELFEDFMMEFTGVFKKLGVSELVYSRRIPDSEENRQGIGVVKRTVSYMVTLEKVSSVRYDRLSKIFVDARTWTFDNQETHRLGGPYSGIKPRYYMLHGQVPTFTVDETPTTEVLIPNTSFFPGDRVYLAPLPGEDIPINPGYYFIYNVIGNPWAEDVKYELTKDIENPEAFVFEEDGSGLIIFVVETNVDISIVDQEFGEKPI